MTSHAVGCPVTLLPIASVETQRDWSSVFLDGQGFSRAGDTPFDLPWDELAVLLSVSIGVLGLYEDLRRHWLISSVKTLELPCKPWMGILESA